MHRAAEVKHKAWEFSVGGDVMQMGQFVRAAAQALNRFMLVAAATLCLAADSWAQTCASGTITAPADNTTVAPPGSTNIDVVFSDPQVWDYNIGECVFATI
jgi:hypothetical protein